MPPKPVGLSKPKGRKPPASSQPKKRQMKRELPELSLPVAKPTLSQAELRHVASQLRQQRRVKAKDKAVHELSPNDNGAEMLIAVSQSTSNPTNIGVFCGSPSAPVYFDDSYYQSQLSRQSISPESRPSI